MASLLRVGVLVAQAPLVTLALPVLLPEPGTPEDKVEDAAQRAQVPRACYLVSGPEEPGTGWRLVALQLGPRRLLLLVSAQSPTHGLRSLATHTLHALTPLL